MLRLSLVLMLLFASPVQAGFDTGNTLYAECTKENPVAAGYCMGYVGGVADVMSDGTPISGWKACVPKNVTIAQIKDIVTRWLANTPQDRHYSADSLVAAALEKAFPC